MRRAIYAISLFLLAGCSTVERRTYYSPIVDQIFAKGPERPYCGFMNFGGLPDTYAFTVDDKKVSLDAYQNYYPYLWGPWLFSVVPVFPITWIVGAFTSDNLTIDIYGDSQILSDLNKNSVFISLSSADNIRIHPTGVNFNGYSTSITFSVDYDSVNAFNLHISGLGREKRELDVPFKKTKRWSWTQWTPNC